VVLPRLPNASSMPAATSASPFDLIGITETNFQNINHK
jgi:hypothetical protein